METKTERNCRVQNLYDELMIEGRRGHYETMFRIVRLEIEAEREACAKTCENLTEEQAEGPGDLAERCANAIRMRSNASLSSGHGCGLGAKYEP